MTTIKSSTCKEMDMIMIKHFSVIVRRIFENVQDKKTFERSANLNRFPVMGLRDLVSLCHYLIQEIFSHLRHCDDSFSGNILDLVTELHDSFHGSFWKRQRFLRRHFLMGPLAESRVELVDFTSLTLLTSKLLCLPAWWSLSLSPLLPLSRLTFNSTICMIQDVDRQTDRQIESALDQTKHTIASRIYPVSEDNDIEVPDWRAFPSPRSNWRRPLEHIMKQNHCCSPSSSQCLEWDGFVRTAGEVDHGRKRGYHL